MWWFNKAGRKDIWDDPVERPLGDIEAAQRIRAICRDAAGCAEAVGSPDKRSPNKQQIERDRYERAAKVAMETAMKISDELVRDSAVREIVGLCMKANNIKTGRALFRAIHAGSIKAEVLREHPTLEGEQA
ncbi:MULTISPECIES: hypothetical protein [Bradyrhizobium]|jgi:isocitrate/isopropylmalate dehydrogenase|uniref:hypothetical protein n=1 Tax=Bradyrhizobium TaxID=374 RepID=UPI000482A104|nr:MULTISPECIES: hypothetical protein [Bradyrhizobium]MBR1157874.1 hypothetical protein [Bradyrhizobium elkanii]MCS3451649.1 isocitrate/isopropylmalate dehydrogenase [Bradyrhizobium elkanii]MCS3566252.1 isocitrate/isopropylmalate dehydrogenase [Bradyrhizobium elkanii]MCW2153018.1 isocitrate/isopropylmalate dehydrogenase [Bradyrhizobium elkanii]MCW2357243.1 isocitrate/isopropylmalate dehydrogenase [Bradyrhizobium elkanii]